MEKRISDALVEEMIRCCAYEDTPEEDGFSNLAPYEGLRSKGELGPLLLSNRCMISPLSIVGSTLRPDETAQRFYLARAWAGLLTTGPIPASVGSDPFLTLTWRPLAEKLHARGAKLSLQIALDGSAPEKAAALAATAPNGLFDGLCLYAREQPEGLLETVRLIRARLSRSFPILCRVSLSPAVYESGLAPEKGQTLPTVGEQLTLFAELSKTGVDAFEVSLGGPATPWLLEPASQLPEGCFAEAARAVKTQFLCLGIRAQVIAFGRLGCPDTAEKLLRRRDCDLISLDGAGLADPDWFKKLTAGETERICPVRLPAFPIEPGTERIAVIGAGRRGLSYAIQAADQGHRVDVYEAAETPGGKLARCRSRAAAEKRALLAWLLGEVGRKPGIRLMAGTKADFALLKKGAYDRLVFACRAEAYRTPCIPGWGEIPYVTADSFSRETAKSWKNKKVAVLGSDAYACELAWLLQSEGFVKKAVLITDKADIMAGEADSDRAWMKHHLPLRGGTIVCTARPIRMRRHILVLEDIASGKERHVVCDRLLLAARSPAPLRLYNEAIREKLAPNIQIL